MSVIFMNYRVADPFFAQSNRRENGERIYSRIDRVVANVDWEVHFDEVIVDYTAKLLLDHCSLHIKFGNMRGARS